MTAASAVPCEPTERDGERLARDFLMGRLTADAVVCANDELALGLMLTLRANGVEVPRELSVTGWDDVLAARHVTPALTTVRQPVRELGAVVVRRIDQLLGRDDHTLLPGRLPTTVVLRQSCGCG
nr:substrate-binding domain-containing protein [Tessaracoccus coleopterorum]